MGVAFRYTTNYGVGMQGRILLVLVFICRGENIVQNKNGRTLIGGRSQTYISPQLTNASYAVAGTGGGVFASGVWGSRGAWSFSPTPPPLIGFAFVLPSIKVLFNPMPIRSTTTVKASLASRIGCAGSI